MASNRLQRTNEDIRLALSSLLRSVKDPRVQQGMISITGVETTGDLKFCKVYLSVLGLESEKEFMKGIKSASGWLRHELGQKLSLRNVPQLTFTLDHSIEHGARINQILSDLDIPEDSQDEY
jgi:ribosome-binding factor A